MKNGKLEEKRGISVELWKNGVNYYHNAVYAKATTATFSTDEGSSKKQKKSDIVPNYSLFVSLNALWWIQAIGQAQIRKYVFYFYFEIEGGLFWLAFRERGDRESERAEYM